MKYYNIMQNKTNKKQLEKFMVSFEKANKKYTENMFKNFTKK